MFCEKGCEGGGGSRYEGGWRQGMRHGAGKIAFFADAVAWEGPWQEHEPCGPGTWHVPAARPLGGSSSSSSSVTTLGEGDGDGNSAGDADKSGIAILELCGSWPGEDELYGGPRARAKWRAAAEAAAVRQGGWTRSRGAAASSRRGSTMSAAPIGAVPQQQQHLTGGALPRRMSSVCCLS